MLLDISFPISFLSLTLVLSHTHTRSTREYGNLFENPLFLLLSFFPPFEGSLSRTFRKNSLHFRWLRFQRKLISSFCGRWRWYLTWMLYVLNVISIKLTFGMMIWLLANWKSYESDHTTKQFSITRAFTLVVSRDRLNRATASEELKMLENFLPAYLSFPTNTYEYPTFHAHTTQSFVVFLAN